MNAIDREGRPAKKQFWAKYNIKKTIVNINESLKEVNEQRVNGWWRKV